MTSIDAAKQLYRRFDRRYPLRQGHPLYRPLFALRARFARSFYVELNHGLANRLGTLISCQAVAEELGREARFIWQVNRLCGCRFNDLFENELPLAAPRRVVDFNDDTTCRPAFLTEHKSFLFSGQGIERFAKCRDGRWDLNNVPFITGTRDAAAEEFSRRLNQLRPVAAVLGLLPDLPAEFIGVHIRRTDLPWQNRSSTETFEQRIDELAADEPGLCFYLATDADEVKARFRALLGDRLIHAPDAGNRTSVDGMRLALADLLALSRARQVLGTFNSSFSWLATLWRLTELEMVGNDNAPGRCSSGEASQPS